MFFFFFLNSILCEDVIATLETSYARAEFNSTGRLRIVDLETGFVYGSGQIALIIGLTPTNATIYSQTKDSITLNVSSSYRSYYLVLKVTAKTTHFEFELLVANVATGSLISPYLYTNYDNYTYQHISSVYMNDSYAISIHSIDGPTVTVSPTIMYMNYQVSNGDVGQDKTFHLTVGHRDQFRKLLQSMMTYILQMI